MTLPRLTTLAYLALPLLATPALSQQPPADSPLASQRVSALISEALDRPVTLELSGPLPDVLEQITAKTDVTLRASPDVYRLLPWGEQTTVTAKIDNQTLRQALTAISARLGLTFILRDTHVELIPRPALARLGTRATVDELNLIGVLATTPLPPRPITTAADLIAAVDATLASVDKSLVVEDRSQEVLARNQPISLPRTTTLEGALDYLVAVTRASWYVEKGKNNPTVLIVSKELITSRKLDRTITARFQNTPVEAVVFRLAEQADLTLSIEPGVYTRLPVAVVDIQAENATVRQVLEQLSGLTGLRYLVKDEGLYIWSTPPAPPAPRPSTPADRVVLLLPGPAGSQLLITESQLTPDLAAYLRHKRQTALDALEQQMKSEGFTPPPTPAPPAPPALN